MNSINEREILKRVRQQFRINWHGIHGISHFARVRCHGIKIAQTCGANIQVVKLFALLHDSCRINENRDPGHGHRAISFANSLHGELFSLDVDGMYQLQYAMKHHSDGLMSSDVTIQTCWDADRLDLFRVGMYPHPDYLSDIALARTSHAERLCNHWLAKRPV